MAASAFLELNVSLINAQGGQAGPPPLGQGWTPPDNYSSALVTLAASDGTQLVIPTGSKLLILYLDTAKNLFLKDSEIADGIPLAATTLPIGLPLVLPLGDDPEVWIANGEASIQYVRQWTL